MPSVVGVPVIVPSELNDNPSYTRVATGGVGGPLQFICPPTV